MVNTKKRTNIARRDFVSGIIGAGALSIAGANTNAAGLVSSQTFIGAKRIDVHAHFIPPRYLEDAIAAGHSKPNGMPGFPKWDARLALDVMERLRVEVAMLSVSAPGINFGDDKKALALARYVNDEGAKVRDNYSTRFGYFAALPLPDVASSLKELARAFDELKVDGVVLTSNYNGIYLGDETFVPVFEELNRRKAVVFIHPNVFECPCCNKSMGYPMPMIEFMFDTTRAVFNLLLTGAIDKYRDIRFIIPHAGATIPLLVDRVIGLAPVVGLKSYPTADVFFENIRRLNFDLAGTPLPRQLKALLEITDPSKILYGSDWPFTPEPGVAAVAKRLDESELLSPAEKMAVYRENALKLFPRFKPA